MRLICRRPKIKGDDDWDEHDEVYSFQESTYSAKNHGYVKPSAIARPSSIARRSSIARPSSIAQSESTCVPKEEAEELKREEYKEALMSISAKHIRSMETRRRTMSYEASSPILTMLDNIKGNQKTEATSEMVSNSIRSSHSKSQQSKPHGASTMVAMLKNARESKQNRMLSTGMVSGMDMGNLLQVHKCSAEQIPPDEQSFTGFNISNYFFDSIEKETRQFVEKLQGLTMLECGPVDRKDDDTEPPEEVGVPAYIDYFSNQNDDRCFPSSIDFANRILSKNKHLQERKVPLPFQPPGFSQVPSTLDMSDITDETQASGEIKFSFIINNEEEYVQSDFYEKRTVMQDEAMTSGNSIVGDAAVMLDFLSRNRTKEAEADDIRSLLCGTMKRLDDVDDYVRQRFDDMLDQSIDSSQSNSYETDDETRASF